MKIYLDTSVFGGVFDNVFKTESNMLFDELLQGRFTALCSTLTVKELSNAPQRVRHFFDQIPMHCIEMVDVPLNARELAQEYINNGVVGETSFDDCVHIATASIYNVDFLISWNFKHIVNVFRIKGYNSVNIKMGYPPIEIRSPKDIIGYETGS